MTEAQGHRLRCRLQPEEVITLLCCASFVCCVTAKFSAELDRVALYVPQLLLDLDVHIVQSIRFVRILPLLEVDPVRKDGVGVEVKVDGVVVFSLEETGTNLRDEVRVLQDDSYCHTPTDTTCLAVSSSGERCTPCSIESRRRAAKVTLEVSSSTRSCKSRTVDDSRVADGLLTIPALGGTGCATSIVPS